MNSLNRRLLILSGIILITGFVIILSECGGGEEVNIVSDYTTPSLSTFIAHGDNYTTTNTSIMPEEHYITCGGSELELNNTFDDAAILYPTFVNTGVIVSLISTYSETFASTNYISVSTYQDIDYWILYAASNEIYDITITSGNVCTSFCQNANVKIDLYMEDATGDPTIFLNSFDMTCNSVASFTIVSTQNKSIYFKVYFPLTATQIGTNSYYDYSIVYTVRSSSKSELCQLLSTEGTANNDDASNAIEIPTSSFGTYLTGLMYSSSDIDYWKFQVDNAHVYKVFYVVGSKCDLTSTGDVQFTLQDSSLNDIVITTLNASNNYKIAYMPNPSVGLSPYYIKVSADNPTWDYGINVRACSGYTNEPPIQSTKYLGDINTSSTSVSDTGILDNNNDTKQLIYSLSSSTGGILDLNINTNIKTSPCDFCEATNIQASISSNVYKDLACTGTKTYNTWLIYDSTNTPDATFSIYMILSGTIADYSANLTFNPVFSVNPLNADNNSQGGDDVQVVTVTTYYSDFLAGLNGQQAYNVKGEGVSDESDYVKIDAPSGGISKIYIVTGTHCSSDLSITATAYQGVTEADANITACNSTTTININITDLGSTNDATLHLTIGTGYADYKVYISQ